MLTLNLISSESKLKILDALLLTDGPLTLRDLVSRTQVGIRSAQLNLSFFVQESLLTKTKHQNKILYQLTDHRLLPALKKFLADLRTIQIKERAKELSKRKPNLLTRLDDLIEFAESFPKYK